MVRGPGEHGIYGSTVWGGCILNTGRKWQCKRARACITRWGIHSRTTELSKNNPAKFCEWHEDLFVAGSESAVCIAKFKLAGFVWRNSVLPDDAPPFT